MATLRSFWMLALMVLLMLPAAARANPEVAGSWSGIVVGSGARIGVVIRLSVLDGVWGGSFDQPEQGFRGIPLENITVSTDGGETRVRFNLRGIPGPPTYELRLVGGKLVGTARQGTFSGTVELQRGEDHFRPRRPQDPTPPLPYTEVLVTFPSVEGVELAGTLTLPEGATADSPRPAVVLISGSGPQDRDHTLAGHRPFLVLADQLARAGLVVLRYDDRGVGLSTGNFAAATTLDFSQDAAAAVRYLLDRPEVRRDAVGLIGHSEGGNVAVLAASRTNLPVAFLVLLASPGVSGREVLVDQMAALQKSLGAPSERVQAISEAQKAVFDAVLAGNRPLAVERIVELLRLQQGLATLTEQGRQMLRQRAEAEANNIFTPWFTVFLRYSPQEDLRRVRVPVLAMTGSLDVQVDADRNLRAIDSALAAGGNPDRTTVKLNGLNHLFQQARTGSVAEYGELDETFNEEAIERILRWLKDRLPVGG
ncbi:MAG: alpha/beta hydrolase family protein [Tepidisphaerales bacterium]